MSQLRKITPENFKSKIKQAKDTRPVSGGFERFIRLMTEADSSSFIAQLSNSLSDINHSEGSCDKDYESFYFLTFLNVNLFFISIKFVI